MTANNKEHQWEFITLAAAAMLMITMGARQSLGCSSLRSILRQGLAS